MYPKNERIVDKKAIDKCKEKGFCQICGHPGKDPHHIITKGSGGPDHEYNLICLCRECHSGVHNGKYDRNWLFYFVSVRERVKVDEELVWKIMRGEADR
jgi:5-methylcytosine-specific restriction endonuclease McrA